MNNFSKITTKYIILFFFVFFSYCWSIENNTLSIEWIALKKQARILLKQSITNDIQIELESTKPIINKSKINCDFSDAEWLVGDMSPFSVMQAVHWCDCQDVPYDNPNPWNLLELEAINLEKGEFKWTWGRVNSKYSINWKNQSYKFNVAKENGKLKISYLEGFNYQKSIKFDN